MSTLFLTRKYPPSRGGMETFSFELISRYQQPHTVIIESGKNILLSTALLFFRSLPHLKNISVIHIGDAVLAPLGALLHLISKKPVVVTVHGLELTSNYGGDFYHAILRWSRKHIAHWVAVSAYTQQLAQAYGIDAKRISIITHKTATVTYTTQTFASARATLEKKYPELTRKKIILSVGRLIQRKGLSWYITHVLTQFSEYTDVVLCIVSDGPERTTLQNMARALALRERVYFYGKVSTEELMHWYASCDIFIFPNIPTPYDVEGFGFTALEAASHGARVYASNIQGIPEALGNGAYGTLLPTLDGAVWTQAMKNALRTQDTEKDKMQRMTKTVVATQWDTAVAAYTQLFETLSKPL